MNTESFQQTAHQLVVAERRRQTEKWGDQSNLPPHVWLMILSEEVGELSTEFYLRYKKADDPKNNRLAEAVQVTAVAVQWLEASLKTSTENALSSLKKFGTPPKKPVVDCWLRLLDAQGALALDLICNEHVNHDTQHLLQRFSWLGLTLIENLLRNQS